MKLRWWFIKDDWTRVKPEKLVIWISNPFAPRKVAYWAAIRVAVYKMNDNPAEQTFVEALKRWET